MVRTAGQIQELSTAFSRVHANERIGEIGWTETLWRILLWMDLKEIFRSREKGEACDGMKILEQRLRISPAFVWLRARSSPKARRASVRALHNIKAFVFSRMEIMMTFLQKIELEAGKENGEQSEGLQKLPDVKILPVPSTANPVTNNGDFGTKQ